MLNFSGFFWEYMKNEVYLQQFIKTLEQVLADEISNYVIVDGTA